MIAIGYRDSKKRLYKFDNIMFRKKKQNQFILENTETKKWHCHFGHLNYARLYHLSKAN